MSVVRTALQSACFAVVAAVMAACSTAPLPTAYANSFNPTSGSAYALGPGDKVRINIYGEEALSGEFLVSNDGKVAVPLVGDVKAGGLSVETFKAEVEKSLIATNMLREPRISIDVVSYRPFYILGEVNQPGQYPYAIGMTATKAVATAKGFTYRANVGTIYVTHEGSTQEVAIPVTAATSIGPGDTVRVAERYF